MSATLAGILVVLGAMLALAGSIGLLTLDSFYERVHPPTMGTTLASGLIIAACMVHFSDTQQRLVAHHLLIGIFMFVTTPVTYMMLVRAALHRDAAKGLDHLASRRRATLAAGTTNEGGRRASASVDKNGDAGAGGQSAAHRE